MATLTSYGTWGLVTGASAGIGTCFARSLAGHGMNVVLTARREQRLRTLADELSSQHGVETRIVAVDLATPGGADRVAAATADLEIGMLVNNAGVGLAGRFERGRYEKLLAMIQLNCTTVAALTYLFLRKMQERRRGAIVIVASLAGYQPVPLHAAYAATKSFDLMLGEALWAENRGTGIDVLAVSPGPVATEFQEVAGETPHPGVPPEMVVDRALAALGRKPSVVVGAGNKLKAWGVRFAPRALTARLANRVMAGYVPADAR